MKNLKILLRVPCVRLTCIVVAALVFVSVLSLIINNAPQKVVAEAAPAAVEIAEPEEAAEEARTYYDVPLTEDVQDRIFDECEKYGISPEIVIAMIERESNYNTYCIGDDGRAAGLMQVQAKWHLERMIALDCTDLFDPCENVTVGIDYLHEQLVRYGDIEKALTAYNSGNYSGTITEYATDVLARAYIIEQKKGD